MKMQDINKRKYIDPIFCKEQDRGTFHEVGKGRVRIVCGHGRGRENRRGRRKGRDGKGKGCGEGKECGRGRRRARKKEVMMKRTVAKKKGFENEKVTKTRTVSQRMCSRL